MTDAYEFNSADIAELLIQIGRLAYAESGETGLTPTQWMALRYFARANRFSRSISAFAGYHSTTRGTVSQTVKMLRERGYLSRQRLESDRRSVQFDLTKKGRDVIAADPLLQLIGLIDELSSDAQQALAVQMAVIVGRLSQVSGRPAFGQCRRCRFLAQDQRGAEDVRGARCRYVEETLEPQDLPGLCVNFEAV